MPDYSIARKDSAPTVIGGVGGSGTRLVAQMLQQQGVRFGGEMNDSLDNLWFSLLSVRRTIFLKSPQEIQQLVWLFINAMRDRLPIPKDLLALIDGAARYDRGPALRKSVLQAARHFIMQGSLPSNEHPLWGWKQPNTHVLVPLRSMYFTNEVHLRGQKRARHGIQLQPKPAKVFLGRHAARG